MSRTTICETCQLPLVTDATACPLCSTPTPPAKLEADRWRQAAARYTQEVEAEVASLEQEKLGAALAIDLASFRIPAGATHRFVHRIQWEALILTDAEAQSMFEHGRALEWSRERHLEP